MYVQLPKWKVYLYDLWKRIDIYKKINTHRYRFGMNREEVLTFRRMLRKYRKGGINQLNKAQQYESIVSYVVQNPHLVEEDEFLLAINKLIIVTQINMEEIKMEISQLRKFGSEVGLKILDMAKLDEKALIKLITEKVDPAINYSPEMAAWYEDLPDSYFENQETESLVAAVGGIDALNDLKLALEETTALADLKDIFKMDEYKSIFANIKLSENRTIKTLKAAMNAAIDQLISGKAETEESTEEKVIEAIVVVDDETKELLIGTIKELASEEDVLTFLNDEEMEKMFIEHLNLEGDSIDVDNIKEQLINLLGGEEVKQEEAAPLTLKERLAAAKAEKDAAAAGKTEESKTAAFTIPEYNPEGNFDANDIYDKANSLPFMSLKKFAKEMELEFDAKANKDTIMDLMANRLVEMSEGVTESTETTSTEITEELVKAAEASNDIDSLIEICESMDIKLNALLKKSARHMATKIYPLLNAKSKEKPLETEDKTADAGERVTIYQTVEQMYANGMSTKDIVDAIQPSFAEAPKKTKVYITRLVTALVEIIDIDNK